ncbi:MAG: thiamine diphosphokinase [Candidatus Thermoplasmatota archaeon]|nr:thiamine diphosphokinase [Candidatus Thermoplasmatota archaeon]
MRRRALIVLAGSDIDDEETYDIVICADSGYTAVSKSGLNADILVGDMDSISDRLLEEARSRGVEVRRYPEDKDMSDGEIALRVALEMGSTSITITGGKEGRLDHILSTVMLPFLVPEGIAVDVKIGSEHLYLLRSGSELKLEEGAIMSIIPVGTSSVTVEGFRWPLEKERLPAGSTRGIHNEPLGGERIIRCDDGSAFVILSGEEV